MNYKNIQPGDRVIDPMDGEVRTVLRITPYNDTDASIRMVDGGVMGSIEINRVYLESETIPGAGSFK